MHRSLSVCPSVRGTCALVIEERKIAANQICHTHLTSQEVMLEGGRKVKCQSHQVFHCSDKLRHN